MPLRVSGQVVGAMPLEAMFEELSERGKRAVLRAGLLRSGRVVLKQFKATAPRAHKGRIRRAARLRVKTVAPGHMEASIGVLRGEAFFWGFLELGTKRIAPRPRLRQALSENQGEIERVMRAAMEPLITARHGREFPTGDIEVAD